MEEEGDFFDIDTCTHDDVVRESSVEICRDCGIEISREISFEQEWQRGNGNKTSRCQVTKVKEKNVKAELTALGFPRDVVDKANELYYIVSQNKTLRNKPRKSLLFACVFKAFIALGSPRTPEELCKVFDIKNKLASKGLTIFSIGIAAQNKGLLETAYIVPIDFVPSILDYFNASSVHTENVRLMYEKIKDKSDALDRAKPKSVAAALVYCYCSINFTVDPSHFAKVVGLSKITISRLAEHINKLLEEDEKKKAEGDTVKNL